MKTPNQKCTGMAKFKMIGSVESLRIQSELTKFYLLNIAQNLKWIMEKLKINSVSEFYSQQCSNAALLLDL